MEEWDIYNANMRKTGKIIYRNEKMKAGEYHMLVLRCC